MYTRKTGVEGEEIGRKYLEERGYVLIEKNYRCKWGEIDLVMKKDEELVFCEVKYRKNSKFGMPQESVGFRKQQRIMKSISCFLKERSFCGKWRIDVLGILGVRDRSFFHIKSAF